MAVIHRLVIVIAFFGALLMLFLVNFSAPGGNSMTAGMTLYAIAIPGIGAAIILYPLGWLFRRRRGVVTYRVL